MKKSKVNSAISLAAVIISILFFTTGVYSATISFMAGDVSVFRNGKTTKAEFQMKLIAGDIVKTGKNSFADISYDGGTVIKVQQNSTVKIGSKNVANSDTLSLAAGTINAKFAKLKKEEPQKIYTPTAVCAVRGTTIDGGVGGGGSSYIYLEEGSADVYNSEGSSQVAQGNGVSADVADKPMPDDFAGGDVAVKAEKDSQDLDNNPDKKIDQFQKYLDILNNRNANASKDIEKINKQPKPFAKESIEVTNIQLENVGNNIEDDLYMNEAANNTIDGILNRFKKDRQDMYNKFLKIKQESNKVLDQQKKNYAAIQAIKEVYRKTKDEILNKDKSYKGQIKEGFDKEKYKPSGTRK